jgi:hypothetical protein
MRHAVLRVTGGIGTIFASDRVNVAYFERNVAVETESLQSFSQAHPTR